MRINNNIKKILFAHAQTGMEIKIPIMTELYCNLE